MHISNPINIIKVILEDKKGKPIVKATQISNVMQTFINDSGGAFIPYNGLELALVEKGKKIYVDDDLLKFCKKNFNFISRLDIFKNAMELTHNASLKKYDEVKIFRYSIYKGGHIYFGLMDEGLLKVSEDEGEVKVSQGTDNTYVQSENTFPPSDNNFIPHITTLDEILDAIEYDENFLSPEKQKLLLKLWIFYSLFDDGHCMRPVLLIAGEAGSCKTLLEKLLKGLFIGYSDDRYLPNTIPKDEHELSLFLKNQKYLFIDELNENNNEIKSVLRVVATGIERKYRPKYSPHMVSFKPKAWLVLNGIDAKATKENDIAQRLLIVTLKRRDEKKLRAVFGPERDMWSKLDQARAHIWKNMIDKIQEIMKNLKRHKDEEIPLDKYFRINDFANFAWQGFPDDRDIILELFNEMDTLQNTHSSQSDPLVDLLEKTIPLLGNNGDGMTKSCKASTLLELIREKGKDLKIHSIPGSADALGKRLKKLETYLKNKYGYEKEWDSHDKSFRYKFKIIENENDEIF